MNILIRRPSANGRRREMLVSTLTRLGLSRATRPLWRNGLAVLAYHRIEDATSATIDTFKPNISASPAGFAAQMDFLSRRFNVVRIHEVLRWLRGYGSLPPYAALITFDDGYRDLLTNALPVLEARRLPAVLFVATDFVAEGRPFYWDLVAYCFHHSLLQSAELPVVGAKRWDTPRDRFWTMWRFVSAVKLLPDEDRRAAVAALPSRLEVHIDGGVLASLNLTWDELREVVRRGIDVGAHTESHPILTRVPLSVARSEILGSRQRLESELGIPVSTFAYPNGRAPDLNGALEDLLRDLGFDAAFSLIPGPAHRLEVRRNPMAIRRIFIDNSDDLPAFAAKVSGWQRFIGL